MAEKEYIDREVILEFLWNTYDIPLDQWMARNYWSKVVEIKQKFISCIEKIPAADVAPVVHGKLIRFIYFGNNVWFGYCSVCGREHRGHSKIDLIANQHYCGNCGAKFEGGWDDV